MLLGAGIIYVTEIHAYQNYAKQEFPVFDMKKRIKKKLNWTYRMKPFLYCGKQIIPLYSDLLVC